MEKAVDLRNMVSVYGSGVKAPLLQTNDARLIQIRDAEGKLFAMMFRLTGALWGFVTNSDPDWEEHRRRLEIDDSKV
jgi:hypothetical protein